MPARPPRPARSNEATPKTRAGATDLHGKAPAIVKASTRLFLKYGYAATTMDMVAEKSRVTKQTVYAYFRSKEILFVHMINALCQKHALPQSLLEDDKQNAEALLYDIGIALLDFFTNPEVLGATRLVISETERYPALAQLYYESGTQLLASMLASCLERQNRQGRLRIPDVASAASYFIAMLKGQYYLRMILGIKPVPEVGLKEQHVRETVAIFLRLYDGEQPMATHSTL